MIVEFFRSSSIGQVRMCELSYALQYVLGMRTPSNKAAARGNVVHKALEVLAWKSYYKARGVAEFEEETFGTLKTDDINWEWCVEQAYEHYKKIESHLKWYDAPARNGKFQGDLKQCKDLTWQCLTDWGGRYNPANQVIINAEQKFHFVIDEPWAHFEYDTPWGKSEGQLSIRGTMDLVTQDHDDPQVLEVVDFKTGRRVDWATGEEKTFAKLMKDPQLLLYYYACTRLFPSAKLILMTILFISNGGPYRLTFGEEDVRAAKDMLRDYFEQVRDIVTPRPRYGDHCNFCWFRQNKWKATDKSWCQHFTSEFRSKNETEMLQVYAKPWAHRSYGSGGGRQASE